MCPWFESRWYHTQNKRTSVRLLHFKPLMESTRIPSHVHIDPVFSHLTDWLTQHNPSSVVVVSDPMTEKWCLPTLTPHLPPGTQFLRLGQHGEKIKSLEHAHALWDSFDGMGMDRNGLVIALGGGTITDLSAFAASTYLRGLSFWLLPTTLLAMVDAAIGGKTGINFRGLKNRIGTFARPAGISIHLPFLDSLNAREMANGWAEHIKHTLISTPDAINCSWEGPMEQAEPAAFIHAIESSISIKSAVVDQDFEERAGARKVLNFGHTVGHALESWALSKDLELKHGEAVAWGMRVALKMSEEHPACPRVQTGAFDAVSRSIARLIPLPCELPSADVLWDLMCTDKKNTNGEVNMILLNGAGQPILNATVTFDAVQHAIHNLPSG